MIQTSIVKSNTLFGEFLLASDAENRREVNPSVLPLYQIYFQNF